MIWFLTLFVSGAVLALDPRGLDPAMIKLPWLTAGLSLSMLATAFRLRPMRWCRMDTLAVVWLVWTLMADSQAPYPARWVLGPLTALLGVSGYFLARRELSRETLRPLLAVCAGFAACSQVAELFYTPSWVSKPGMPAYELVGSLANPNLTAALVLLGAPCLIAQTGLFGIVLVSVALLGSLSRGVFLGGAAIALFYAVSSRQSAGSSPPPVSKKSRKQGGKLSTPSPHPAKAWGAALGIAALLVFSQGKLHPQQLFRSRTIQSRLELWKRFRHAVFTRPFWGYGSGGAGVAFALHPVGPGEKSLLPDANHRAHNPLLQRAVEGGLFGLLLTLLAGGIILKSSGSSFDPVVAGILGFLVSESVSVGLETPLLRMVFWLVVGGRMAPPTSHSDAPPPPERSPLAFFLGLLLLRFGPLAWGQAEAQVLRRHARGQTPEGKAYSVPLEAPDRLQNLELRYDTAAQLVLERRNVGGRSRFLVLESRFPRFVSSEEYRKSLRELSR